MEVQVAPHRVVFNDEPPGRLDDSGNPVALHRDTVDVRIRNLRDQFGVVARLKHLQRPRGRPGTHIYNEYQAQRRDPRHPLTPDPPHRYSSRSSNRNNPMRPPCMANTSR